jgi:hypothetical protein
MQTSFLKSIAALAFICLSQLLYGQDTLFFKDGSYAIGKVKELSFKKVKYLQISESGDTVEKSERASNLDSLFFHGRNQYRKGVFNPDNLPADWYAFAAYWEGRICGEKGTTFSKSQIAASYVSGLLVVGLPYSLYKASHSAAAEDLPTIQANRYRNDSNFATGYKKGVKRTHLQAMLPLYLAGVISSLLGVAILVPQP